MTPGCELGPPSGSPEVWALPRSAKCCSLHNCAKTRSQLPFSWYFHPCCIHSGMGACFGPGRIQTPQERQELFIVPDSDEVPAQQKIYVSVTWASICPRGPRPGSGVMFCPCSCAELMPTWLNNLLAPVFCPKVLNLVTTPLLPSPLSVRNKYFWTWNKY